jgi:hypothetical protein
MSSVLIVLAAIAGAVAGIRGVALVARGLRAADDPRASLWLIRGIRGIAVAVGTTSLAAGLVLDQKWLLVFGAVFLLEELYETGVVALLLRADAEHASSGAPQPRTGRAPGHQAT